MIALLAAALLQAGIPDPSVLTVRAGQSEAVVPIVATREGRAVQLDRIAPIVPVTLDQGDDGSFAVTFAGVEFSVSEHSPYMKLGGKVIPLASAPFLVDGRLYLPLQAVTDQLPRAAPDKLRYNPVTGELRLLGAAVGSTAAIRGAFGGAAPSPATAPPAAAPPAPTTRVATATAARTPPSRVTRPATGRAPARAKLRQKRLVVLDAGHGGPDRGMSGPIKGGPRIYEKNITLQVTRRLRAALQARGIETLMTRDRDTLIALSDRGRIANAANGDLFVSIHVNAANLRWKRPYDARGFETFFLSEAKTEDARHVEQMENEAVRFETGAHASKSDPLSFIINDMARNEHLRESSDLATVIQTRLGDVHPGPNRGVKQANFAVLRTSFMPAVLVEIGFGTNADEARFISDAARQEEIAQAIADATVEYLEHYERRVGVAGR
jgi:N-acetylmuramoyl-L-alanine amidase